MSSDVRVPHSIYGRPIEILLVEDNSDEASLTMETLKEGRVRNNITLLEDGVEAITFLRREGRYANACRPDLILLDLKLPRKNGREVLGEIKGDNDLKRIPVVILTASQAEEDILKAYNLYANCYIVKSIDFDDFMKAINAIKHFWLNIVKLPEE